MDPKQSARPVEPADSDAQSAKEGDTQPAGRIVHDARGNAVWRWAGTSGSEASINSVESTSSMLRRLEIPGLKVEGQEEEPPRSAPRAPTASAPQPKKAAPPTDVRQGYDPYDQTVVIRKPTTPKGPVVRPVQAAKPAQGANPAPAPKPKP
jgi:hypothetical protein